MNDQAGYMVAMGGASAAALAFFADSITNMIPWLIAAVPLIVLDLRFGIKAAKCRKERIRFSTAFRRTFGKGVEYLCWIVLASTLSLAFKHDWIEWAVLGVVIINELASIIGNYLETKGLKFSWVGFYRWLIRAGSEKAGIVMEQAEAEEIISQARDPKTGRFISNKQK